MYGTPPPPGSWGPTPYPPPQPWGAAPPAGAFEVGRKARLALGFSLPGFFLCCAPIGIAGLVFGVQSLSLAKKHGVPAPAKAVVSIVLGGISTVFFVLAIINGVAEQKKREARIAETKDALAGKLEAPRLDPKTACLLFEKQLLHGLYEKNDRVKDVKCNGSFDGDARRATLRGVEAEVGGVKKVMTACFARSTRWFALSALPGTATCPTVEVPPPPARQTKASEGELDAEEDDLRTTIEERGATEAVAEFTRMLDDVETGLLGYDPRETKCPTIDPKAHGGGAALDIPSVDFDYLKAPADTRNARDDWSFMTSAKVKTALDARTDTKSRASAVRALRGPYVAVFTGDDRAWPSVAAARGLLGKKGYYGGDFDGWLVLVATSTAKPVCASRFAFENSAKVRTGKRPSDDALMRELKDDLKDNFKKASKKEIDTMTGGKLRFEFGFFD